MTIDPGKAPHVRLPRRSPDRQGHDVAKRRSLTAARAPRAACDDASTASSPPRPTTTPTSRARWAPSWRRARTRRAFRRVRLRPGNAPKNGWFANASYRALAPHATAPPSRGGRKRAATRPATLKADRKTKRKARLRPGTPGGHRRAAGKNPLPAKVYNAANRLSVSRACGSGRRATSGAAPRRHVPPSEHGVGGNHDAAASNSPASAATTKERNMAAPDDACDTSRTSRKKRVPGKLQRAKAGVRAKLGLGGRTRAPRPVLYMRGFSRQYDHRQPLPAKRVAGAAPPSRAGCVPTLTTAESAARRKVKAANATYVWCRLGYSRRIPCCSTARSHAGRSRRLYDAKAATRSHARGREDNGVLSDGNRAGATRAHHGQVRVPRRQGSRQSRPWCLRGLRLELGGRHHGVLHQPGAHQPI